MLSSLTPDPLKLDLFHPPGPRSFRWIFPIPLVFQKVKNFNHFAHFWHVSCKFIFWKGDGVKKELSSITRLILERAAEEAQFAPPTGQPAVLSCGGMYLPRTKNSISLKVRYQVLNLANESEPVKVYVGRQRVMNQLHQILLKEGMN